MSRPAAVRPIAAAALLLGLLTAPTPSPAEEIRGKAGDSGISVHGFKAADSISPEQLREVRSAIAAYEKRKAAGQVPSLPKADGPYLYPFFPQAGVQERDLFLSNFTDQDRGAGIRDWDCSDYTYDGHQGHDSLIRSFREQAIGVPVFAARDGVVIVAHDGEPDMNTVWDQRNRANYVLIDHGQGYRAWYFHFRTGSVSVAEGQTVKAGQQIGFTGSSGLSNWPHLHFETEKDGIWIEPSAGPCGSRDSLWVDQPRVFRDLEVVGFHFSNGPVDDSTRDVYLRDESPRTGTFVKGLRTVGTSMDLRNLPAFTQVMLRVVNPRRQVVQSYRGTFTNDVLFEVADTNFWFTLNLDVPGTWHFQTELDGNLVLDAPFQVVATSRQVKNRKPNKIAARLTPSRPVAGEVLTCAVQSPLVLRDPDYDIVSYRYEWRVNNRVVRTVTSAALTDLLAADTAAPSDKVSCKVTATDGKSAAQPAKAAVVVE